MNRLLTTLVQMSLWLIVLWCFKEAYEYHKAEYWQRMIAQAKRANEQRRKQLKKRFVYCDGPHKRKPLYAELVTSNVFYHYDRYVSYPVFDVNSTTVYFSVPSNDEQMR